MSHDHSSPQPQIQGWVDHKYHLVNPSPWPFVGSMSLLGLTLGMAMSMHKMPAQFPIVGNILMIAGLLGVLYTMFVWWRDVIREGIHEKAHTPVVSIGLKFGMALFITSEVMFFVAFFWAFFDASIFPKLPVSDIWPVLEGAIWPPEGIETLDAWDIPFINTLILLLSGTTVTWAHHALLQNNRKDLITGLWLTVLLGFTFTALQAYEYHHAAFGFKDGIYASTFYMATGFHGFHVLVGTLFLSVCLWRAYQPTHLTPEKHLGFEFAAWYWHFVDVVWLFLFTFVYWWGGA